MKLIFRQLMIVKKLLKVIINLFSILNILDKMLLQKKHNDIFLFFSNNFEEENVFEIRSTNINIHLNKVKMMKLL